MAKERDNSEALVGRAFNLIFRKLDRENRAFWLEKYEHYNNLPKVRSKERKIASGFLTEIAEGILQNPQEINFMQEGLIDKKNSALAQDPKQLFVQKVKDNCLTLIKDKWEGVKPEHLAQLVRISSDINDPSQADAKKMLTKYFKGPKSRNQRAHAYYNFVSGVLDLAGEDEAFSEGMRIVLHATDILPRNPNLIEQTVLLSMPYDEDEKVFQELITARYVIDQIGFISSYDFMKYHRENNHFLITDDIAKREWNKKREIVTRKIGRAKAREFNDIMMGFFQTSKEPLSEERKQELMGTWPFDVAFKDPLNQKFNKVFSDQLSHSSQVYPEQRRRVPS